MTHEERVGYDLDLFVAEQRLNYNLAEEKELKTRLKILRNDIDICRDKIGVLKLILAEDDSHD